MEVGLRPTPIHCRRHWAFIGGMSLPRLIPHRAYEQGSSGYEGSCIVGICTSIDD